MQGINFLTNDKNERIAVQIEMTTLLEHADAVEEFLDILIAESRKDDDKISLEDFKQELKSEGRL